MMLTFNGLPNESYVRLHHLVKERRTSPGFALLPFSPATLWRMVKAGKFPAPVKLGTNMTVWLVGDVRAWLAAQDVGRPPTPACGPKPRPPGA